MKKSLLLTFCLLLSSLILTSAPIDTLLSKRVATNFYRERIGSDANDRGLTPTPILVKTYKSAPTTLRGDSAICLYIYNVGDGYVIVSGDNRVKPVLGYSTEGQFDPQNIPVQLDEWLMGYTAEIQSVMNSSTYTNVDAEASWSRLASSNFTPTRYGSVVVAPLIQTCWNQSPYYNSLCPMDGSTQTVTGCVATAMAQLLWYWKYPSHGIGSHSYTHPTYGEQSANFGATTYNYDLMPTSLNSSSSAAQVFEVAQLMYHCGVSVDMDYGLSANGGSGAVSAHAADAFNTYFGYSCTHKYRSSVSNDALWISDLKAELNHARPVLYHGRGSGGHAFICDGYTVDSYFHFNFGWGCYQDGYFTIDHIEPGSNYFTTEQGAIFNMSAANPILLTNINALNFFSENSVITEGRKINVLTHNLTNNITITTSSPFAVSLDSVNYSTSITLSSNGGNFYVRYQPSPGNQSNTGTVNLVSGSKSASIDLQGFSCTISCLPPQDFTISSSDLQHLHLSWNAPQVDQTEHTLSWNDRALGTRYSYGTSQLTLLQRFSEADLVAYHGQSLTKITSYVVNGATALKLVAFKGGSYTGTSIEPGTLVYEQTIPISSVTQDTWNTFTLTTPIPIDASQELWFGIYLESTASYPIPLGPTYTPKKGTIIGLGSMSNTSWRDLDYLSLCILGTIQNTQALSHYEISRNGTVLGNTSNTYYDDVVGSTNTYHYNVAAVWDNGCSSSASLTITNIPSILPNPDMLVLHNNSGFNVEVKKTNISGMGLTSSIQATVTSPFQISTDSVSFSTSKTLPTSGGTLYVRYNPSTYPTTPDLGTITLTSGSATAQVQLVGQGTGDCNPPQNLTLSAPTSGATVTATWDAPDAMSDNTYDLTWHVTNMNSYTQYSNLTLYALQRFESSDLAPYHNKKITAISFMPNTDYLTTCKVVVFKGGTWSSTASNRNAGTLVAEQVVPISSINDWVWNTVTLNAPVVIDANQELWFGIYLEYSQDCSSPRFGSTATANKSAIYRNGTNNWTSNNSRSFAIKASVEDNNPTFDHYKIDRNGSVLVNNTTSTSYADNVGINGDYDYTVWAVWSDGCQSGVNGSVSVTGGCTTPGTVTTQNQCGGTYTWHGTSYNASGTYTYAFMNNLHCHQVDTLHLTIHSAPTVTISGNNSICSGANTTLTASGANSYTWSTGASGNSITVNPTSSAPYTVTGTDSHGCTGNATVTVTVTPVSLASVTTANVTNVTTSAATCGGTVTSDACSPVTARGVCWSTSHNPTVTGSHTTNGTGTGTFTSNLSGLTENTTYYVRAYATTAAGTQYGAEKSFKTGCSAVTVTISGNTSICSGANTTLSASGANSYTWSTGATGSSITVNPTSSTPYTVTGTNSHGCTGNATVTVTVTPASLATVTTANVTNVTTSTATCGGTVTSDACSPVTARGVCWSTSHNPTITSSHTTNGTGTGTFTSNLSGLTENTTYYVRAYATTAAGTQYGAEKSFKTGCSAVTVTISGNTSICSGASTTLTASGANSYTWSTGASGSSITVNPTANTPYTVTGTNSHGCTGNATVTVTVTPVSLATVTTANVTNVTTSTATCGGTVTSDACSPVTARGICWSSSHNPTISGSHTSNGTGTGTFTSNLTGLAENMTYYVRAYATTAAGTQYGAEKTFTTNCGVHELTVSGNTTIYSGTSTTLYASGANSYHWYPNNENTSSITVSPSTTSTYTVIGTMANGCSTEPATITVTVTNCIPAQSIETATACDSYTWHGVTYTQSTNSATYTISHGAANGCDSIVTLHLTIFHPQHQAFTANACKSYTWNGTTYTQSGTYRYSHSDAHGCTQVDTLHLTIYTPQHQAYTVSECGQYTWNGTTYTQSGTYQYSHPDAHGCTQVDTLHLTIIPIPVVTISGNTSILEGQSTTLTASGAQSYVWSTGAHSGSITVTPTATNTYTVTGYNGSCASQQASVTVTVGSCIPSQSVETITACNNYTWHGFSYTQSTNSATYTIPHGAANGCDSIVTLHLTIYKPQHKAYTVNACESYIWNGTIYLQSGNFLYQHTDVNGCTQVDTLHLTIYNPQHQAYTVSECGQYNWNGTTYTQSGTYKHSHTDAHGCTQVDTLHLTITPIPNVTISGNTSVLEGQSTTLTASGAQSYVWSTGAHTSSITVTPTAPTTYTVTGYNGNCVSQPVQVYVSTHACTPVFGIETVHSCGPYLWHGVNYPSSNYTATYTYPGAAANGCDSTVTLHLTVDNPVTRHLTLTDCDRHIWNGQTYTQSGDYTQHFQTNAGCDSTVILHLTIRHPHHTAASASECNAYTWHGQTYTQSGIYTYAHADAYGCTQVDTLHLTVFHPQHAAITTSECGSFTWNGTTYTQSGTYTYAHVDANGCTQVDTLHLTIRPIPTVSVTGNTTIPLYESTTLTASGADNYVWSTGSHTASITVSPASTTTYYVTGSANGCSSQTASITVVVGNCIPAQGIETAVACESFTWHGTTYTQSTNAPTFVMIGAAATGCDSIVTLHLTVNHPVPTITEDAVCDSYTWHGTTYTQSGVYTYAHPDANGCNQVDTLKLTVFHPQHEAFTDSECLSYVWNGTTYTQSGVYTFSHPDEHGCTQVDTLHLTIFYPQHEAISVSQCDNYTWNGTTYTQSGTYTFAHADINGCTQVDTLHLTIFRSTTSQFSASNCESYTWNGVTYTRSGEYVQHFQTVHGCDSTVTLQLTIFQPRHTSFTAINCDSYTWAWNGQTYTESGDYTYSHPDAHGCTQVDTLHVTINHPQHQSTTISACNSYYWNGMRRTQSGTYTYTHRDDHGCWQVDTLHLTIFRPQHTAFAASACGSYTWNGQTYNRSGNYTFSHPDANGCTQIDTLHLTIFQPVTTNLTQFGCNSYTWNDSTYTESGDYTQHFQTVNGCDSTVILHLTIITPQHQSTTVSACDLYSWNNTTYYESGTYTFAREEAYGCMRVDTLHLTINHPTSTQWSATACDLFTWNNNTYANSGNYIQHFRTAAGCDSTVTLHLTIHHSVSTEWSATNCDSYTWNESTYYESGNYVKYFQTIHGCDSTVTLHLTIRKARHLSYTASNCHSYTWNGQTYTQTGTYLHSHNDQNGCTQVDTLHLTIFGDQSTDLTVSSCGPYTWNGQTYNRSGDFIQRFFTAHGCDSTVTLHLTVNNAQTNHIYETACDNFTWNGITFSASGNYSQTFQSSAGCDSTVTLHLTINHSKTNEFNHTACNSYTWNGQTYYQSGEYVQTLVTAGGCDSTVTLHLTINTAVAHEFSATACDSYTWNGITYTSSGNYTQHLQTPLGCDSTVTLHLTVFHPQHASTRISACEFYSWNGSLYLQSGTYMHSHTDQHGCTQVDTLHLTINHAVVNEIYETSCGNYTWGGQTYTGNGTYTKTFQSAQGCDSTVILHLTVRHPQHTAVTADACLFYNWNGMQYVQSGTYTHPHFDANGCTQVDTLHLTIHHAVSHEFNAATCDSYTWNGQTYTSSGNYTQTLQTPIGCDSIVTLHLTIHNSVTNEFNATACDSYTWNGITFSSSGDYTQYFQTSHGCDSTVTLHLTIHNSVTGDFNATACDSYTWNTQTYTQTGNYTQSFQTSHGCDSTVTLHLTIHNSATTEFSATACESYTWNGQTYTQTGNYTQSFQTSHGCDSTVTLQLTVYYPQHMAFSATECGSSYTWNGNTYISSGTYTYPHTDLHGCIQVDTLHLTLYNTQNQAYTIIACNSYTWHDVPYFSTGNYTYSYYNSNGCMQTDTLHLTIQQSTTQDFTITSCESYIWNGQTYTQSGNYTQQFQTIYGCDSTVTLHLTVYQPQHTAITVTECGSFTWNGQTYSTSGDYLFSHTDAHGCTQVDTLHLTIHQPQNTSVTIDECQYFTWNGTTYNESGTYTYQHTDVHGCTQVDTLHLTIHHPQNTEFSVTVADSCYTWNGTEYCENGNYLQLFSDQYGCDSIVTLHLQVNVGIEEYVLNDQIIVYPNPTTGTLQVQSSAPKVQRVEVYDAYGKMLLTVNANDSKVALNLSGHAAGTYFLRIATDKGTVTKRIIRLDN